jgi:hypothetical protein
LESRGTQREREITTNMSDITIKNKKEETIIMIDVAIPENINNKQKEAEKTEIQSFMHSVKMNVVYGTYGFVCVYIWLYR